MENIHLKLESVNGNEIVLREGSALPQREPVKINISGDIKTVSSFIAGRKDVSDSIAGFQYINKGRAVVEVDKQKRTIVLMLDPSDPYGGVITAKMELNPDLVDFCINAKKTFKQKELVELLKFSGLSFDNAEKHAILLRAYQSFNAKAYIDMASDSDNRGNKSSSFNKKVETNLPVDFVLNMPIFKGQDRKRFSIEICLEVTDGGCNFWFESVELKELIEIESQQILDEELKSCSDYVVIWK
ncbi:MAG TPA: hypothetical protein VF008_09855 [Niastella sp.]